MLHVALITIASTPLIISYLIFCRAAGEFGKPVNNSDEESSSSEEDDDDDPSKEPDWEKLMTGISQLMTMVGEKPKT